jgi:ribosome-associated protein
LTDTRELARLAAQAASSKQGEAIVILDVRELITITDYFVIASGASDRQVDSIADEVVRQLKVHGTRPVRTEGDPTSRWILLDFVDFVVHLFHPETRSFYQLERLWDDAPELLISST